jgi:hypothetical protein
MAEYPERSIGQRQRLAMFRAAGYVSDGPLRYRGRSIGAPERCRTGGNYAVTDVPPEDGKECLGSRTFALPPPLPRMISCFIHQVAYVEKAKPFDGSNRSMAVCKPDSPCLRRSASRSLWPYVLRVIPRVEDSHRIGCCVQKDFQFERACIVRLLGTVRSGV